MKLATLHNEEDLRRKDVRDGRRGDRHARRRRDPAGGVAHGQGAEVARSAPSRPKPPSKCPSCGTPTIKPEEGVWTICPNRASCPGQLFQAVKHFVGAMDIDGLGEENVRRFLSEGLIASMADLYELDVERVAALEGFGEISARNLVAALDASREQPFMRVLYGLGIPGIGYVNARVLAQHLRDHGHAAGGRRRGHRAGARYRPDPRPHDRADAGRGADARADRAPPRTRAPDGGRGAAARRGRRTARRQDARAHGHPPRA